MAIFDHDGTTERKMKYIFDHDGTTERTINYVYDHDGTTERVLFHKQAWLKPCVPPVATKYSEDPGYWAWSGWSAGAWFTIKDYSQLTGVGLVRNRVDNTSQYGKESAGEVRLVNSSNVQVAFARLNGSWNNYSGTYDVDTAFAFDIKGFNGAYRLEIRTGEKRDNISSAPTGYVSVALHDDLWLK